MIEILYTKNLFAVGLLDLLRNKKLEKSILFQGIYAPLFIYQKSFRSGSIASLPNYQNEGCNLKFQGQEYHN